MNHNRVPETKSTDPILGELAKLNGNPPPQWLDENLAAWDRTAGKTGFLEPGPFDWDHEPTYYPGQSSNSATIGDRNAERRVGETIDQWQIVRFIGRGGFGDVFEVRSQATEGEIDQRRYALKIYRHERVGIAARLDIERLCLETMQHPNLVSAIQSGTTLSGEPYLVMQFVDGIRIDHYCRDHQLGYQEIARLFAVVSDAMAHAHHHDILHRDLKPGNILVTAGHKPVIVDFGLAKKLGQGTGCTLTGSGELLGTLAYLSPEQADSRDHEVTRRTDIYGIGASLYRILTGQPPIDAPDLVTALTFLLEKDVTPPRLICVDVPTDLESICLKCLEKEPYLRYQTMEELADDLRRFAEGRPVHARGLRTHERLLRWSRRHPKRAASTAAVILSLIVGFAAVTFLWRQATVRQEETMRLLEMTLASSDEVDRRAETMLKQAQGTLEFRQKQLEESVRFMDEVLVAFPENEDVIRQSLVSYFRLAKVLELREQFPASVHSFQMAAFRAEQLLQKNPDNVEVKFDLFHCWLGLYSVDRGSEQKQINRNYLKTAMQLISEICRLESDNPDYQDALACTALLYSMYNQNSGRINEALQMADLSWKTALALKENTLQPSQKWRHTGTAALQHANIYLELGQLDVARQWCEVARAETWEFVNRDNIDLPRELLDWSQVLLTWIELELMSGNHEAARELYAEVLAWGKNCIARYPDHHYFQTEFDNIIASINGKFPDYRE